MTEVGEGRCLWHAPEARPTLHVTGAPAMVAESNSTRRKVSAHRERLRRQGLRPIQIWVPDTRAPTFKAEAHRQSAAVAASTHVDDDQAFIDAVTAPIDE
jgi:hypothetical protein